LFNALSEKLDTIFKKIRGKGKLNEKDINESLKEVKIALLEADANYKVVKDLIEGIKEKALGQEVLKSLTPGQQVVKIVYDEITKLMGERLADIELSGAPPSVILLVGLQGSGKTTTAAKLAKGFKKDNLRPLLVSSDIYRPAAIEQLTVLGEQLEIPVHNKDKNSKDPLQICKAAVEYARVNRFHPLIIDTAGRLHIDETLMEELKKIKEEVKPEEILLIADAMTGQDAVNIAKSFNESLGIDGIVLTKMDGDARGGAALSMKTVTGKPIKLIGTGEKLDFLEPFHPDRMASRILGMGDLSTIIEKSREAISIEEAKELEKKIKKETFSLEDFKEQIKQIKKMGSLDQLMGMIPGTKKIKGLKVDDGELFKIEAIINSMTPKEKDNCSIINGSRRKRIARGSGTSVQDVNKLLKQFTQTKQMMKQFSRMGNIKNMFPSIS
jgi:signal recognition particle subunit SRP54